MQKYILTDVSTESPFLSAFPATVREGIAFLKQADFSQTPNGKSDVDGKRIYINIMEYESHSPREAVIEKHEKYIDIQYIITGREYMGAVKYNDGCANLVKVPFSAEKDLTLFQLPAMPFFENDTESDQKAVFCQGEFCIFTPDDLHASMIYVDRPEQVRKVIVKCLVE